MDFFKQLEPLINAVIEFAREHTTLLLIVLSSVLLWFLIRKWPDRAKRVFQSAGLRVPDRKVKDLREDLADIAAERGRQVLRAMTQQQQKIEAVKHERERVKHLIRANPLLVKEVGEALKAVEKQYIQNVEAVESEAAKEVLRLSTEKAINDILQSVNHSSSNKVHQFHLPAENTSHEAHLG